MSGQSEDKRTIKVVMVQGIDPHILGCATRFMENLPSGWSLMQIKGLNREREVTDLCLKHR